MKISSMYPQGNIRAVASVNINQAFAIRNVRLIEGSNGLFVSMPSYKAGNGEYKDICFPVTAEARAKLNEAVIGAYEQTLEQGQQTTRQNGSQEQTSAPQGMAMAGM